MSKDYRSRIYERYATSLERGAGYSSHNRFYDLLTAKHVTDQDASLLELGAGSGALLSHLSGLGFKHLVGVDGSLEQVELARSLGVDVRHGDVLDFLRASPSELYDVVIAVDLVEHLRKQEAFDLFEEAFRVLRPRGKLIVHTVNGDSPFFGTIRYGDFTHETTFTKASIGQVLRTVGFRGVECFEDKPIVHGAISLGRSALWSLLRQAAVVALAAETGSYDRSRILSQNFLTVAMR